MLQSLRSRSLLYYLIVTTVILGVFGSGVYVVFRRSLYRQRDKKLLTLAQSATPSFTAVRERGSKYLNQVEEVPWRDIFNRDQQSLEWLDKNGNLLGRQGLIKPDVPPEVGATYIENPETGEIFRTHTISLFIRRSSEAGSPTLVGFIRATQSNEEIEAAEEKLFWILIIGSMLTLILIGSGG
ncbi:MAG: two-component sensor histidine kinase, partial [Cyanobacteria bacterium J06631_2]